MLKLYAFLEINSRINNLVTGFDPLGELSPYSKTFTPDLRVEAKTNITTAFFDHVPGTSAENAVVENVRLAISDYLDSLNLHVGTNGALAAWAESEIGDATTGNDVGGFRYRYIASGNAALVSPGNNTADWFKFSVTNLPLENMQFEVELWVTDARFRDEYPLARFDVVPPLDNTLDIMQNFPIAKSTIITRRIDQHMDRAQEHLAGKVITGMESVTLRMYNPSNPADFFDCPFFIGYNGNFGVNYSTLIQAIIDFLLGLGGGYDLEDWLAVIPQLNSLGNYFVIPVWNSIAIANPNPSLAPIMYRPLANFHDGSLFTVDKVWAEYLDGMYTQAQTREKSEYGVSSFKSAGFYIIPDIANEGGAAPRFSVKFPDFITFNINSLDSVNITSVTENVIRDIHMTIQQAESYVNPSPAPEGYAVETINGKRWISIENPFGRAKIFVLTRENFVAF